MAFVSGLPVLTNNNTIFDGGAKAGAGRNNVCVHMSMGNYNVSRRGLMRLGGLAIAGVAVSEVYALDAETKKELDGVLGTIDYEDELTDVGPDAAAELKVREKKDVPAPEYVAENAEIEEEADKKFDQMVAKEQAEAEAIKSKFAKKK